ncbi:hypothetical protein [Aureispira anguillae]|nr:hypothetical protein [Aureispira anguillae]
MLVINILSFFASTLFGDWPFHSWFVLFLIVSKIGGGLVFVVLGIQLSISIMWIVGIVMLAVALIGAIFAAIVFGASGGFRLW